LFLQWQVCSIVLAGAFLPYTFFFWSYVIELRDNRYLAHALIMHGLWGVSWLLISLPLAWTWYEWNTRYKLRASIAATRPDFDKTQEHSTLELGSLLGSWNVMGSLAGVVLAFGYPILKEVINHF
jgi:hypothetical protein